MSVNSDFRLLIHGPGEPDYFFLLPLGVTTIGRLDDSSLRLRSDEVSRNHARITCWPAHCELTDLNSSNGTFVNGNKCPAGVPVALQDGDQIQIGYFVLTVTQVTAGAAQRDDWPPDPMYAPLPSPWEDQSNAPPQYGPPQTGARGDDWVESEPMESGAWEDDWAESAPPESAGAEPEESGADDRAPLPPPPPPAAPPASRDHASGSPEYREPLTPMAPPRPTRGESSVGADVPKDVRSPDGEQADPDRALIEELVRLDLAVPKTPVIVNFVFEIAVAIRQPASDLLSIDGLDSVHSADGVVYRQPGQTLVRYKVKVSAPDCAIETAEYTFLLRAGQDSPPRFFQLTPRRAGELSIIVTAYQEDELMIAQTRVRVQAAVQAVGAQPASADDARADLLQEMERVRSEAEADNPLRLALYRAMRGPAFSLDDLEEMCFLLDLDWDLLEGETKDRKARAMIRYFSSRADLSRLNQAVRDARPNLDLG